MIIPTTLPFQSLKRPLNIAHRGSMVLAHENTFGAFRLAVESGADVLETDVRLSSDGELVVFHDREVDRTREGRGAIRAHTLEELEKLKTRTIPAGIGAGSVGTDSSAEFTGEIAAASRPNDDTTIPTLDALLEEFSGRYFSIDVKDAEIAAARKAIDIVRAHGAADRVVLASFHVKIARYLRAEAPEIAVPADKHRSLRALASGGIMGYPAGSFFMLPAYRSEVFPERANRSGLDTGPVPPLLFGSFFIRAVHRRGGLVFVWTVDEPADMHRLLEIGVDGIVTNRPDLLAKVLRE